MSKPVLQEGLNVLGKLHGVVNSDFELQPIPSVEELQQISPSRIDAAGPLVFVHNDKLEWVAPDITATRDLFYGKNREGNWILTDDFFSIAREFSSLTFPRRVFVYFVRHGFLPPGKTFFNQIARVRVGTRLVFRELDPQEEDIWREKERKPRSYETFKRALSSVFETYPFGDQASISLSAGCDSGLVAAVASLKYGKRPLAITTVTPKQPLKVNEIDAANAGRITRHLGLEHAVLEFDFNAHHAEELRQIAHAMPIAAHLALHHFEIGAEAVRRGKTQLWQGQSADSAYNLGPTQRSLGGPLRRFYFTKEYWQGLPDISGNKLIGSIARALGILGPILWQKTHGQVLRQPTSFQELMATFADSEEDLPLPAKDSKRLSGFPKKLSTREAREEFFAWKAQAFLTGRDPRIRYTVADHYGLEAVLPYTAANMIWFFRGLEMDLRDVFAPKRYIYRYLQELWGEKAYKEFYQGQEKRVSAASFLTWAQWQEKVLASTVFGKELREQAVAGGLPRRFQAERDWNPSDLEHALGLLWTNYVFSEMENCGVLITISFI